MFVQIINFHGVPKHAFMMQCSQFLSPNAVALILRRLKCRIPPDECGIRPSTAEELRESRNKLRSSHCVPTQVFKSHRLACHCSHGNERNLWLSILIMNGALGGQP
ncbi:hypothetical protein AVEN_258819-1 [Araneus ventricosus]|uniref:Uncharacterized protein n=1 Tax=Araneus ventricosus TaxID=182803 RepID=A0A4Y2ISG1_ARAVE|nr:hypothetical protein AVEN_258819-1 [Araneus ventricosus]